MRTYDKLIATIHARQGAAVILRARFGVIGPPLIRWQPAVGAMAPSQGKNSQHP